MLIYLISLFGESLCSFYTGSCCRSKKNISVCDLDAAKAALSTSLILDVREPAEYAAGCLTGAINIPHGVLEFRISSHPDFQDKQQKNITVYCLKGGRSALTTEALNKLGYSNARIRLNSY